MLSDRLNKGQAFRMFTASIGAVLVATLLLVLLNSLLGFYDDNGQYTTTGFWWANVISQTVLIVVVVVFCKISQVNYLQATTLNKLPDWRVLLTAMGVGVGLFCFMNPIQGWILQLFESFGYVATTNVPLSKDPANVVLLILVVALLPAVAEEQLFRGAITRGLKDMGLVNACLLSGALFMIFHMSPAQTVHQFVMGVVLAFLVLKSDCIYTSVAVHFLNNLIVLLLSVYMGPTNADKMVADYWYLFLFGGLIVAGLSLYAFIRLTKDNKVEKVIAEGANKESGNVLNADKAKSEAHSKGSADFMVLCVGLLACLVMWLSNLTSNIGG